MTFEQFGTIWKDFKSGTLTIVTARGGWEVTHGKEQLSIQPVSQLFIYRETPTSPQFMFDISAVDHVRYED